MKELLYSIFQDRRKTMRDFRSLLQRTKGGSINYFSPIILHKEDCSINMSIQASRFNYSSPRIDNLSAYDYDEFEDDFVSDDDAQEANLWN